MTRRTLLSLPPLAALDPEKLSALGAREVPEQLDDWTDKWTYRSWTVMWTGWKTSMTSMAIAGQLIAYPPDPALRVGIGIALPNLRGATVNRGVEFPIHAETEAQLRFVQTREGRTKLLGIARNAMQVLINRAIEGNWIGGRDFVNFVQVVEIL